MLKLTVSGAYTAEDDVSGLIHLDVTDAVAAPLLEKDGNLLACTSSRNDKAKVLCDWLDPEQTGKPILLWLNVPSSHVVLCFLLARGPTSVIMHSDWFCPRGFVRFEACTACQ